MIDKVISPVILIVTVSFFGIILYLSVFNGIESDATVNRQRYEQEYGTLLVESVFAAQEDDSGMTYESLMVRALRDVNTTIEVSNKTIDVKREYAEAFDELLGPGNYYLEIAPLLQGVTVSYVLDGSNTMAAKRDYVNNSLQPFIDSLERIFDPGATINAHIYILKQDATSSMCGGFYSASGVTCEDIGGAPLYSFLRERGISPPAPEPSRSYAEWKASTHLTSDFDLSQSDWASGVMYASFKHYENDVEMAVSNKHVIVTVADELTTTSKGDECFGIKAMPPEPEYIASNNLLFCYMCNAEIPENRSFRIINQTALVLDDHNDMFIGFNSFVCDYEYNDMFDDFGVSNYSCQYLDNAPACSRFASSGGSGGPRLPGPLGRVVYSPGDLITGDAILDPGDIPGGIGFGGIGLPGDGEPDPNYPPAERRWCDQANCKACKRSTTFPWDGKYCFHREADNIILAHQQILADASGGRVLTLTDISQLTSTIESYFQNLIEAFDFRLGEKDPARDRYVFEKDIMFPNGEKVHILLWLYDTAKEDEEAAP